MIIAIRQQGSVCMQNGSQDIMLLWPLVVALKDRPNFEEG